jgi:TonB-linked SusC/RagA family outer membrane protein
MKKTFDLWISTDPFLKKLIMEIKLAFLIIVVSLSNLLATETYSQVAKVSLEMENRSLEQVMDEIEKQSEFYFIFNQKQIDIHRIVDIKAENKLITDILPELFKGTNVNYAVLDRKILLTTDRIQNNLKDWGIANEPQAHMISGKVTDDQTGEGMAGVNIQIKGTTLGTSTNAGGEYSISVANGNVTLIFSFIGYNTQEVPVNGKTIIDVKLVSETTGLDEVVVVGYGTQKRKSITSSFSSVDVVDAVKVPTSSVAQSLQGRAAGLSANLSSAQPGGSVNLQIRGSATGRSPLIVIDGMPTSDFTIPTVGRLGTGSLDAVLSTLNANDIESIDILKDASATSIYGSKAAGGVILITTKRGKTDGAFSVSLNSSAGIQSFYKLPVMLNPVEFMEGTNSVLRERWLYNRREGVYSAVPKPANWSPPGVFSPFYTEGQINEFVSGQKTGTDWVGEVTRPGRVQNHDLSLQGSTRDTRFYASFGAYDQKGIVKKNDYSKYSGRVNVDQNLGEKFNIGINLSFSQIKTDNVSIGDGGLWENAGVLLQAMQFDPTLPVRNADGGFQLNTRMANYLNPVSVLEIDNNSRLERFLSTAYLNYKILPGLSIRGQIGFDRNQAFSYGYIPTTVLPGASVGGRADRSDKLQSNYQGQLLLNYLKTFRAKHNLSATLGSEYISYLTETTWLRAQGFPFDGVTYHNMGLGADRPSVGTGGGSSEIISYFLRTNYDFDYKYFLNVNLRIDGSSKFSPVNQYAFFPGISVGWDIARESFLDFSDSWLNQLKLRAGYGITGNDQIGTAFADWYSPGANTYWGTATISGVKLAGLGNPDLKWEKQTDINVGLDFSLLKNDRISGSLDIFNREISRILGIKQLLSYNAVTTLNSNIDALKQTYGAEFTLNSKNITSVDLSWNSTFTFSFYRDRWLKRDPSFVYAINDSERQFFDELWYYKSDGLVPVNTSDPLNPVPGLVKILDVNGYKVNGEGQWIRDEKGKPQYSGEPDGQINAADLVKVGVNIPITIGFSNALNYKNFDVSIHTYGMFNRWKINATKYLLAGPAKDNIVQVSLNMIKDNFDERWSNDNQSGSESSSLQAYIGKYGTGDFYLENAWFVRVRSINMGYTLLQKKLRIYCDLLNPILFTPYTGMDPETDTYVGPYPNQRTFALGVQLNFK